MNQSQGALSVDWQKTILVSDYDIPDDMVSYVPYFEQALISWPVAILDSSDFVKLKLGSLFRNEIVEMHKRIYPELYTAGLLPTSPAPAAAAAPAQ